MPEGNLLPPKGAPPPFPSLGEEKERAPVPRRPFRFMSLRSSGLLRQGSARLGNDRLEGVALVHRDVGQDLAVEIDAGELEAVHELAVGQAFGADRGVDALDPQGAEAALLHLAVAIGILPGLLDRLAGGPGRALAGGRKTPRPLEQTPV